MTTADDFSNGWEAVADRLANGRSFIGAATVRAWARTLPRGSAVVDLACGSGIPISKAMMEEGLVVSGIDASPTLVAAFHRHFPDARVVCEPAEHTTFFGETFDAVVAVGLMFLLDEDIQRHVIRRVAGALKPGGRFLFTAPVICGCWLDAWTDRPSLSLGDAAYREAIAAAGLSVAAEYTDEGDNHYYDTVKTGR